MQALKLAIAGKGGVGKTTLAAALARILAGEGRSVVAIDADPNNCLGRALGFPEEVLAAVTPLSEMKERLATLAGRSGGGSYFALDPPVTDLLDEHVVTHEGISLLVMGTVDEPGAGCVCPESAVLKSVVRELVGQDDTAVVLDMEAGLEHLGRGTARHIGALLIVTEPAPASARTAARIARLARGLGLRVPGVVVNRASPSDGAAVRPYLEGLAVIGTLPFDASVQTAERVPASGPYVSAVARLLDRLDSEVEGLEMGKVIAITGKGGVGKTTLAALAVRLLVEAEQGPVLAVDADPNLNLNAALGVEVEQTVGDIREEGLDRVAALPGGMAKSEFLRLRVQQALVEQPGFDLLAMGRPEGPGCYCFANSILRNCVDQIGRQYAYLVVDCEAGLEHLSRRTAGEMSCLLVLSDLSLRALETARRVLELVEGLKTRVDQVAFAFTRVRGDVPAELLRAAIEWGLPYPYLIPEDAEVEALEALGRPLVGVSTESPALRATRAMLQSVGLLPLVGIPASVS